MRSVIMPGDAVQVSEIHCRWSLNGMESFPKREKPWFHWIDRWPAMFFLMVVSCSFCSRCPASLGWLGKHGIIQAIWLWITILIPS